MAPTPPLTQTVTVVRRPDGGRLGLAALVKRTYAIDRAGRLTLADEQVPLVDDPPFTLTPEGEMGELLDDTDYLPPKVATDVVVVGTAYGYEKVRELMLGVAVGKDARLARVWGPRRASVAGDGTVSFSSAGAFESMPLSYEQAYGGYDEHAHQVLMPPTPESPHEIYELYDETEDAPEPDVRPLRLTGLFAYPRNPIGVGYWVDLDRHRADGAPLPRLEDPADELTPDRFFVPSPFAWIDAPIPGGFGWIQHSWFPRLVRLVGPLLEHDPPARPLREAQLADGEDLRDLRAPALESVLPRGLQGAAPGMAVRRLVGNEPVELRHLHREQRAWTFELPGETPVITLKPPGLGVISPKPVLQTVRIEPDRDRVSLTWCAMVPLAAMVTSDFTDETELGVSFRS